MISEVDKQRYIKHPYNCPYCESNDIEVQEKLCDYDIVTLIICCGNCRKKWAEIYHLVDIEEMDDE